MTGPAAVVFDVGNVLYDWDPRFLYERLIGDDRALDAFLRDVATKEWHFQHDEGRPFAETSAELSAAYPHYADMIALWGPRFSETIPGMLPGMADLVAEIDSAGVPLFAITNFSGEFWKPFRAREAAVFDRFRDIVVSGDERLVKPDPAIYRLALDRFGLEPGEAVFVDDRADNIEGANGVGMHGLQFIDAPTLRAQLAGLGLLPA
ncbi:MAG: HAD family phosphatase [Candidatus Sphingomonas phytovorans]|nr:HAD family phosphatase [Sphingomonas sp.]WEJ98647.1 MAG: HAD family phosphatase [Sphingomonas sp.]